MKKSEAQLPVGEKLETPVRLTPEQLESVAAGFTLKLSLRSGGGGGTATTGAYPPPPPPDIKLY
jgi:hypothetical protein